MSEDDMLKRQSTIDDITAFIDASCQQLDALLHRLQWNKEEILKEDKTLKTCPVNSNHMVPEASLQRHIHDCQLVAEGYSRHEQKEIPESHSFYYAESTSVVPVIIDKETQRDILSRIPGGNPHKEVPRTVDRMDKAFTPAERLALHDAILEKAKASKTEGSVALKDLEFDPEAVLKKEGPDKPKSRMEILAELRDYKRRRQSYRAKNVHITRRSQTEIMREVIEAQMTEIQQALQGYDAENRGSPSSQDRPISRNASRSPVRSRDASRSPVRSREASRSPTRSCSRRSDYNRERHRDYKKSERSEGSDYRRRGNGSNSREASPKRYSSRTDIQRSRNYSKDAELTRIKIEKDDAPRSRESSKSPKRSRSHRDKSRDSPERPTTPMDHIKEEDGSHNSSRTRRDERTSEGSRHRSKHKHKHRHHSRDGD